MDSGRGFMEAISEELYEKAEAKFKPHPGRKFGKKRQTKSGVFKVGEEIEIKAAWFRVNKIDSYGIRLKSIPSKPTCP